MNFQSRLQKGISNLFSSIFSPIIFKFLLPLWESLMNLYLKNILPILVDFLGLFPHRNLENPRKLYIPRRENDEYNQVLNDIVDDILNEILYQEGRCQEQKTIHESTQDDS